MEIKIESAHVVFLLRVFAILLGGFALLLKAVADLTREVYTLRVQFEQQRDARNPTRSDTTKRKHRRKK